jgi:8-oxo-dGTP pyrophosphatase MutT (NUDIX family)
MGDHHASSGLDGGDLLLVCIAAAVTAEHPAHQIAALPFRKRRGKLEVLLITSRETKRWVIPKGWPMVGLKDYNAAKQEAFEEAGVQGRIGTKAIGHFDYHKRLKTGADRHCRVEIYPLKVFAMKRNWPEKHERTRTWFSVEEAAQKVGEAELSVLIGKLK